MASLIQSSKRSNRFFLWRRKVTQGSAYVLLIASSFVFLAPMGLMLINSFKSDLEMRRNASGLPLEWTLESYSKIFEFHGGLWYNFINSVLIAGTSTVLAVLMCSLAAYAFSKFRFRGREIIFALLLATMMVPPEIVFPGLYIMFSKIGLINTLQVQILPTVTPVLGLFLMRQYMLDIPDALLDAARIDGAGHLRVYWNIMVPTSAPILGAYAILHFMSVWNAFTWPTLVAQKIAIQPIMVVLPQLVDTTTGMLPTWGTIMAGCVLATLPILIVFILFQDTFMSSVVIGAVKE